MDDWTTMLQIQIFSSAVKPVMIICFLKPHSPLNSRIIRVLQTVTQDCKFATHLMSEDVTDYTFSRRQVQHGVMHIEKSERDSLVGGGTGGAM
jgi:hypothetical protein